SAPAMGRANSSMPLRRDESLNMDRGPALQPECQAVQAAGAGLGDYLTRSPTTSGCRSRPTGRKLALSHPLSSGIHGIWKDEGRRRAEQAERVDELARPPLIPHRNLPGGARDRAEQLPARAADAGRRHLRRPERERGWRPGNDQWSAEKGDLIDV